MSNRAICEMSQISDLAGQRAWALEEHAKECHVWLWGT
jgi:hypothetical protein